MPLPLPSLDDRDFQRLLADAMQRLRQTNPAWDDLTPHDPGIVLLDLFAYLTDTMIYRLNQLPTKVYVALLRLLGVSLYPPAAARVTLRFSRTRSIAAQTAIEIPRGTRVSIQGSGTDAPIFATARAVTLEADQDFVEVLAYHAEQVEGEFIGKGSGFPGLALSVGRPPMVQPTGDPLDLIVAVESAPGEIDEHVASIGYEGTPYRIWREVANFSNVGDDRAVYVTDRMSGTILFAPALQANDSDVSAALADVPTAGRAIRVWYRRGGGTKGNVAAGTLTVLKDPIPNVQVTNPEAATGGREGETLENALVRGPKELHSLERAVTASDFELIARKTPGIARARAVTQAQLWSYAPRGSASVTLVPDVPGDQWSSGHLPVALLEANQTEPTRAEVQRQLDERRPMGTRADVQWAHYKPVRVSARIVVRREENAQAVQSRVVARLNRTINPLPSPAQGIQAWPFGQSLRVSNVYDAALSEPGVRWVENVVLEVDDVPEQVVTLAADQFQAATWYAGDKNQIYRSSNDGTGWELIQTLPDEERVEIIKAHPNAPGMITAIARVGDSEQSHVYSSRDCGETWESITTVEFHVEDAAWMRRDHLPVLLLATDAGLYEVANVRPQAEVLQLLVNPKNQAMSFYAVAVATDLRGQVTVAVAAQNSGGVYLSTNGGQSRSFRPLMGAVEGKDVRVLAVETREARSWLWAGTYAFGDDVGNGCYRWELRGDEDPVEGWVAMNAGWTGGSCRALAFVQHRALAATHRGGVMFIDPTQNSPAWRQPTVNSGLPIRDLAKGWFTTVETVVASPQGTLAMAGIARDEDTKRNGIYKTPDSEADYDQWVYSLCSTGRFADMVTLPATWLFTSGEHEVSVVGEDEAR